MNGAALAILAGVWTLAQLFRGQALQRLGILGPGITTSSSSAPPGGFEQGTQTKIPGSA